MYIKHRLPRRSITTNEAVYWKSTNVVRRNLLMTAVRRSLSNDWNPEGETGSHMRQASFDNLKILAVRRLSDTIVSFFFLSVQILCQVQSQRITSSDTHFFFFSSFFFSFRPTI